MVLIFTDNEQLDKDLKEKISDSRIAYYTDYILEEPEVTTLIATIQPEKYDFKEFMFEVRKRNIQVILILENEKIKELNEALVLGIYDIIFDPFDLDEICEKISNPSPFSKISKYIENIMELIKK